VANTLGMDLSESAHHLPGVYFNECDWQMLFVFTVVARDTRDSVGYEFSHCVQLEFVLLLSLGLECMFEVDDVGVVQFTQDLQFTILLSFVLIYFLDGHNLTCFFYIRFKYYSKCTLSYNFFS